MTYISPKTFLMLNNTEINHAVGDFVLARFPEADVTMFDDGRYEKIEFVKDGVHYAFDAKKKTGRFTFSAKPLHEVLSPDALLGVSMKEFNRLCNTGSCVLPKEAAPAVGKGCYRVYREGGDLLVTNREFYDLDLIARLPSIGKTVAFAGEQGPGVRVFFDKAMWSELVGYLGGKMFREETRPRMFDGDEYAGLSAEEDEKEPPRRIPHDVFTYVCGAYEAWLARWACENPVVAADSVRGVINEGLAGQELLPAIHIFRILVGGSKRDMGALAETVTTMHYVNRWVEVNRHRWVFVTMADVVCRINNLRKRVSQMSTEPEAENSFKQW